MGNLPFDVVRAHLHAVTEHPCDRFGCSPKGLWMSAMVPETFAYPEDSAPDVDNAVAPMPDGCTVLPGKRAYRCIDAPHGSSLYWDQPSIVAAWNTGDAALKEAVRRYVNGFLAHCVAQNGMFLWGNHYYFDAYQNAVVRFEGDEAPYPVDFTSEKGDLHETRPIPPAWELLYEIDPSATARCIRAMAEGHIFDKESGGFNRHADGKIGCAFLESGGILAEALCFLYSKTGEKSLLETARRVIGFSLSHRNVKTGLIENNPTVTRWDKRISTTECGLWAGSLLRAADYAGQEDLRLIAADTVRAYLRYGLEKDSGRLYGRLFVATGEPDRSPRETLFQPETYASAVEPIFPAHDYPYALMETCVKLFEKTGESIFRDAVAGWLKTVEPSFEETGILYAEHLGRAMHLCLRGAGALGLDSRGLAERILKRALKDLGPGPLLLGHTGAKAYSAIDGVGYLLLAMQYLHNGRPMDLRGFAF